MIASDLARPDNLPDGEDSTSAPSSTIQTLPQSGIHESPAWFSFSYPLPKPNQPTSRQKYPEPLCSTWQTNPHSIRQAAYYK